MKNLQVIEKLRPDTGTLDLVDIFYTIQGEGPFSGQPAVFIRTAGCPLNCPLCDTDYTSNRQTYTVGHIIETVNKMWAGPVSCRESPLVVVTGGEPFRQHIGPLIERLIEGGHRVQIETSGAVFDPEIPNWLYRHATLVCSPKTKVADLLKPHVNALKYVLRAGEVDETGDMLPTSVLGNGIRPERPWPEFKGQVFVSPCWEDDPEANRKNTKLCVEACLRHGYRLSLQVHKIIGVA